MFCTTCGAPMQDGARFCGKCGAAVTDPVPGGAPVPAAVPAQPQVTPQFRQQSMPQVGPSSFNFSRIPVRYRCAGGHIFDGNEGQTVCPTCGAPLPAGGLIQLYRMGNYMGMAVGMGIYIDDVPHGHIANKQSIRISVPYGRHKVHVTHTTTRKCNDPVFEITPDQPCVWCKAHFSAAGFKITVEQADPKDMPTA